MKVDVVVNSMIQQIDRNLLSQVMPILMFRAGEILHGRVMLDAGDQPQIRLDSGELLSALPSGDVQLFAGATVTLRVTGNMDGQFVMQLLDQEIDGRAAAGRPPETAGDNLSRLGLDNSAQGKAVIAAMLTMHLPPREEIARQAIKILSANPSLDPEKAVFLAANGITPTDASVNALNALIDGGATTGGELMKLADILASQTIDTENAVNTVGIPMQIEQASAQNTATQVPSPAGWTATPQPAVEERSAAPQIATPWQGAAAPGSSSQGEAMLELQSLISVALNPETMDRYSAVMSALQRQGLAGEAVRLALDGSFATGQEYESALTAFSASLSEDMAGEARALVMNLADGLRSHAQTQATARSSAENAPIGLRRVVGEIMDLFVRLDADAASNTLELQRSPESTRDTVRHLPTALADTGAAGPDAAIQLGRVESHVRLIDNINQYAYQQMPVEINGHPKNVELYVMNRNGNGRKINPEKANILIALDTENMGRLETMISVNSKNLRLRFGVENSELMGYVNSYTSEIGRAMQEIGFKLSDVRAQIISRPLTPINAIAEAESMQESPAGLDIKL